MINMAAPYTSPFASATPTPPAQQFPQGPSTLYNPPPSPMRNNKRRADSPPTPQAFPTDHDRPKRRRPNLQSGFATMSISPTPNQVPGLQDDSDESEVETSYRSPPGVHVQYLPDKSVSPARVRKPRRDPAHRTSSFSSASAPSDDEYDSDVTFRLPHERARLQQLHESAQHASEIEYPSEADHSRGPLVEPIDSPVKRKYLSIDNGHAPLMEDLAPQLKRQRSDIPEDLDMDANMDEEHIDSGPGWYEPEKDRIVVTSLSAGSSRSPSPDPGPRRADHTYSYQEHKHLAQPGDSGFTISPSLLTHIIGAQQENMLPSMPKERGLILYRPIGPPGVGTPEDVVKHWDGNYVDSGRFEEIDDDEDTMMPDPSPVTQWQGNNEEDVPMDMDMD